MVLYDDDYDSDDYDDDHDGDDRRKCHIGCQHW